MTTTTGRFARDAEAARPFQAAYEVIRAELAATGQYPYNDIFKGRIPGLAGEPDEDRGIYLLQRLHTLDEERARLDAFLAEGGYPATEHDPDKPFRGTIVEVGFYAGDTGWRQHEDARLVFRNGKPFAAMPPRAQTRGHILSGRVYLMGKADANH